VLLQERDDRLSAAPAKREFRPAQSDNYRFVTAALDFLLAAVAFGDGHGVNLCGCILELCNASLVILQLVFMAAKLCGARHVFFPVRLELIHDGIEFGDYRSKLVIELMVYVFETFSHKCGELLEVLDSGVISLWLSHITLSYNLWKACQMSIILLSIGSSNRQTKSNWRRNVTFLPLCLP
jgi:hypothetical protein